MGKNLNEPIQNHVVCKNLLLLDDSDFETIHLQHLEKYSLQSYHKVLKIDRILEKK